MDRVEIFETLAQKLTDFREQGGGTIVDSTGMFHGRDVPLYEALSRSTGVHIVASTGMGPEEMLGGYFLTPQTNPPTPWPAEKFADLFTREVTEGMVVPRVERRGAAGLVVTAPPRGHDRHRREPPPRRRPRRPDHRRPRLHPRRRRRRARAGGRPRRGAAGGPRRRRRARPPDAVAQASAQGRRPRRLRRPRPVGLEDGAHLRPRAAGLVAERSGLATGTGSSVEQRDRRGQGPARPTTAVRPRVGVRPRSSGPTGLSDEWTIQRILVATTRATC